MKGPVIVCGASFMSPASKGKYKDFHFSELVAKALETDLVVLSTGGCSNFAIALQIEKAISWKPTPSLVLLGNTETDRIEIPTTLLKSDKIEITIDDMFYHLDMYKSHRRTSDPKFFSTCLKDFYQPITVEHLQKECPEMLSKVKPVHSYFADLYHYGIKRKLDLQLIYSYYHKIHSSNIPYFICIESTRTDSNDIPWMYEDNRAIPNYLHDKINKLLKHDKDSPYHTDIETQEKITNLILKTYNEIYFNCGR